MISGKVAEAPCFHESDVSGTEGLRPRNDALFFGKGPSVGPAPTPAEAMATVHLLNTGQHACRFMFEI
jgi:hypothetical protein